MKNLFAGLNVGSVIAYECQHYKLLTEANRNRNYGKLMGTCDRKLAEGWYRFAGGAGMQMLTSCTTRDHCDTRYPGWFWGRLPHVREGCISAHVCFGTAYEGCCLTKKKILVRNCGKFYVYKLGPVPNCPGRYCGEWLTSVLGWNILFVCKYRNCRIAERCTSPIIK